MCNYSKIFIYCNNVALVFFLLLSLSGMAIANAEQPNQEKITATIEKLRGFNLVQGEFQQQKTLKGLSYPLKTQGHFVFWKSHGLYLANEKPFFNATTITTEAMINWQADGTGSVSQEQNGFIQREINKTLLAFFSADVAAIEQHFEASWVFEKDDWQLTLTPKLDMIKKHMTSAIMHGNRFLNQLDVTAANGDVTHIDFSKITEQNKATTDQCRWFYLQNADKQCQF